MTWKDDLIRLNQGRELCKQGNEGVHPCTGVSCNCRLFATVETWSIWGRLIYVRGTHRQILEDLV